MHDQPVDDGDPSYSPIRRAGAGSLVGPVIVQDDWDSVETNEEIADAFYR